LDELLAEIKVDNSLPPAYEYDPEHNVYFEDCVEGMAERLDDDSVDCVITDPPYGIDYESGHREVSELDTVLSDESVEDAVRLFRDCVAEIDRVTKKSSHIIVFCRYDTRSEFATILSEHFDLHGEVVWVKDNHGTGDLSGGFAPRHETALHAVSESPRELTRPRPDSIFECAREGKASGFDYDHPTQKPTALFDELIRKTTPENGVVLDPFMGSGTTAVAAIQNDRDYVGFELDDDNYKPVIERRISEAKRQMESDVNQEARADD